MEPTTDPSLLPCPSCQCPPRIALVSVDSLIVDVACPNRCLAIQGLRASAMATWNDTVMARHLLTDLHIIASKCQDDTVRVADGPTTFELFWVEETQQYQARIVWWHHDGPIDESDAASTTPDDAIHQLAATLKGTQ